MSTDFPPDLLKGSFAPVILSLLAERPMYGYEMVKLVDARTGGKLKWREGTLYPTLHKLETEGQIISEWRQSDSNRDRKYYLITPAGRRELKKRATQFKDFATTLAALLPE